MLGQEEHPAGKKTRERRRQRWRWRESGADFKWFCRQELKQQNISLAADCQTLVGWTKNEI